LATLIKLFCGLTLVVWAGIAQPGSGKFTSDCSLPFTPTGGLKIDESCGMFGSAAGNTSEGLQNKAKNNFCAAGTPATVTPAILLSLQQATSRANVSFGSHGQLPNDRSALEKGFSISGKSYHEGQLVHLAAFFIETHAADLSSGESVNCDTKEDPLGNDVHMALGTAYGADECTSVTAELSPHFRPGDWKILADIKPKDKTKKPDPITQFPVRITGQLFFDASHKLCSSGKAVEGNPARQSAWEIHPVYQVDVCRNQTLSACEADQADVWVPIKNWKPAGN
jgi:hypothetical protein